MTRESFRLQFGDIRWPAILKLAAIGVGAVALMAGFDFTTPAKRFAKQDSTIARNTIAINHIEVKQARTDDNVGIMLKLSCLDPRVSRRDQQLVGLKCDSLLDTGAQQAGRPR